MKRLIDLCIVFASAIVFALKSFLSVSVSVSGAAELSRRLPSTRMDKKSTAVSSTTQPGNQINQANQISNIKYQISIQSWPSPPPQHPPPFPLKPPAAKDPRPAPSSTFSSAPQTAENPLFYSTRIPPFPVHPSPFHPCKINQLSMSE